MCQVRWLNFFFWKNVLSRLNTLSLALFYLPFIKKQSIRQIAYYYTKHYLEGESFHIGPSSRFEKKNLMCQVKRTILLKIVFLLLLKTSTFDLTQCHLRVAIIWIMININFIKSQKLICFYCLPWHLNIAKKKKLKKMLIFQDFSSQLSSSICVQKCEDQRICDSTRDPCVHVLRLHDRHFLMRLSNTSHYASNVVRKQMV